MYVNTDYMILCNDRKENTKVLQLQTDILLLFTVYIDISNLKHFCQKNLKFTSLPPEGNVILFHPIFSSLRPVLNHGQEGALRCEWSGGRQAAHLDGSPVISPEHTHTSLAHIHIQGPFKRVVFTCLFVVCLFGLHVGLEPHLLDDMDRLDMSSSDI